MLPNDCDTEELVFLRLQGFPSNSTQQSNRRVMTSRTKKKRCLELFIRAKQTAGNKASQNWQREVCFKIKQENKANQKQKAKLRLSIM